ncbi:Nucleoside triphosphatase nudI [Edwardsiella ictaluri]|nr:Nucleoside triphosphatase nudI [Edwardsiella ictaluri]
MLDALTREINEELGDSLNITKISPWSFRDDIREKTYKDGTKEKIYMIYLIFDCKSSNRDISFNDEFQEVAWVSKDKLNEFNLNEATKITFTEKGFIK